ncbi:hypothetical protein NSERUTF1_1648 [Nocardia seriolae]|nr:hypothetical protein NSERUTF1_1648 [Nocardia seriolae]
MLSLIVKTIDFLLLATLIHRTGPRSRCAGIPSARRPW